MTALLDDAADTINFATNPGEVFEDGSLIRLLSELEIIESLTIDGSSSGGDVIITGDAAGNDVVIGGITNVAAILDGQDLLADNSRVLNFSARSGDLALYGLTITGGRTAADNDRGGH